MLEKQDNPRGHESNLNTKGAAEIKRSNRETVREEIERDQEILLFIVASKELFQVPLFMTVSNF